MFWIGVGMAGFYLLLWLGVGAWVGYAALYAGIYGVSYLLLPLSGGEFVGLDIVLGVGLLGFAGGLVVGWAAILRRLVWWARSEWAKRSARRVNKIVRGPSAD